MTSIVTKETIGVYRGSAWQIACELMNSLKFTQVPKNDIFAFFLSGPSQLMLKYASMLDILIHHTVHMTNFDYSLPIFQNFEKTICALIDCYLISSFPVIYYLTSFLQRFKINIFHSYFYNSLNAFNITSFNFFTRIFHHFIQLCCVELCLAWVFYLSYFAEISYLAYLIF